MDTDKYIYLFKPIMDTNYMYIVLSQLWISTWHIKFKYGYRLETRSFKQVMDTD